MKLLLLALCASGLFGQTNPTTATVFDNQLKGLEREFVPLVEAMPANKFTFAPKVGAFKGVRTFVTQAKHVAFVMYSVSSALLGEKNPSEGGADENGPANIQSKEEVAKYVKDAFAYAHTAMATLSAENMLNPTTPTNKSTRLASAILIVFHGFDHYGQMVEYARMNNIIPPASR